MTKGIIYDIKRFAIHDGPGIRTTVFLKGCCCDCWWCHNPESRSPDIFTCQKEVRLDGIKVNRTQVIGEEIDTQQLMHEIEKDMVFFEQSQGGVTFSGGEPLQQIDFLRDMLILCKEKGLHTTLDTTAFCEPSVLRSIEPYVDLFMVDLKFMDEDLHRKYVGVSNRLILENLKDLLDKGKRVWLRIPVVPNVNTSDIDKMIAFLNECPKPEQMNLLPYHKIGRHKYKQFGLAYRLDGIEEPTEAFMQMLKQKFEKHLNKVEIGG